MCAMKQKKNYRKRVVDDILRRKLQGVGAVLLEGPRWCGKTTTCEQQAKSILYMADPDSLERNLAQAETNIKIAELEKEYLKKFKEVLPASKILKVQNAEEQFNSQILKDIQQSRGHQFQQGQQRPGQPQQQRPQFNRSGN